MLQQSNTHLSPTHRGLTITLELQGCLLPSYPHNPLGSTGAPACPSSRLWPRRLQSPPHLWPRWGALRTSWSCPVLALHGFSHRGNLSNATRAKGGSSGRSTKNSCTDPYFLSVFHELVFWSTMFIFKVSYFLVHAKDCYSATPTAAGRHFLQAPQHTERQIKSKL